MALKLIDEDFLDNARKNYMELYSGSNSDGNNVLVGRVGMIDIIKQQLQSLPDQELQVADNLERVVEIEKVHSSDLIEEMRKVQPYYKEAASKTVESQDEEVSKLIFHVHELLLAERSHSYIVDQLKQKYFITKK